MSNFDSLVTGDEPDELFVRVSALPRVQVSADILTEDFPDPVMPITLSFGECQSSGRKHSTHRMIKLGRICGGVAVPPLMSEVVPLLLFRELLPPLALGLGKVDIGSVMEVGAGIVDRGILISSQQRTRVLTAPITRVSIGLRSACWWNLKRRYRGVGSERRSGRDTAVRHFRSTAPLSMAPYLPQPWFLCCLNLFCSPLWSLSG
jgi:hypothetical protein